MPIDQGQLFEKDRFGYNREEYKHHGLEPHGTTGGQGGGAIKEILKSESPYDKSCQEQLEDMAVMDHEQGDAQHHRQELGGRKEDTEISGEYHDQKTTVGYSKKKKKKRQNVKRNDIRQLSVKMKSQIVAESKVKTNPEELQSIENVAMKRVNTPSQTGSPKGLGEGVDAGHVNSAPLSLSSCEGPGSVTEVKQPEGEEDNGDQLSIYPEPERINPTDNLSKSMVTKVSDKDPPDRLQIPIVCQIQEDPT